MTTLDEIRAAVREVARMGPPLPAGFIVGPGIWRALQHLPAAEVDSRLSVPGVKITLCKYLRPFAIHPCDADGAPLLRGGA